MCCNSLPDPKLVATTSAAQVADPLPGRPVLVRVAAFRPETRRFLQAAAAANCDPLNKSQKRSVESSKKQEKKLQTLAPFSRRFCVAERSLATVRRTVRAVSQLFFSHTHTHSRFNCTEKKRRRLIKRNYSKCMVLKKSDSKRHTVKHTKAKRKKNLVGGEESKTFLIYYLYISCKIPQVKIKLKVCASLCASELRARGGIGTSNKCYRDNTHTQKSLRRSVKQTLKSSVNKSN